jgi:hypothetical protein
LGGEEHQKAGDRVSNAELFAAALCEARDASDFAAAIGKRGERMSHAESLRLLTHLKAATCAAQELERRAAGVPEPRKGD